MKNAANIFLKVEKWLFFIAMAVLLFFVFMATLCRYCHLSWPYWSEELSRVLMVWLALLGGGVLCRTGDHFTVNALFMIMPEKVQRVFFAIIQLIVWAFAVLIIYYGIANCIKVSGMNQSSPALQIPMWVLYVVVPICGLSVLIQSSFYYIPLITGKKKYVSDTDKEIEKIEADKEIEKTLNSAEGGEDL